ncbi:hypothetical protein [Dehalogenimonas sp. 4OHTPN]|uniref:Uncharacterized protein n=1 Tax=Dehalogenimonas sp. 4OHTPN TaxID=3166643 RepID=A0AAU8GAI5_9CHLR
MKTEKEIRQKLEYYRGILAIIEAKRTRTRSEGYFKGARPFPEDALHLLTAGANVDEVITDSPPAEQEFIRQWFGSLSASALQLITALAGILGWVLDEAEVVEGVTPHQAK